MRIPDGSWRPQTDTVLAVWHNVSTEDYEIFPEVLETELNPYKGGVFQQAVSGLPSSDQRSYELLNPDRFSTYGFEYLPSVSRSAWLFGFCAYFSTLTFCPICHSNTETAQARRPSLLGRSATRSLGG